MSFNPLVFFTSLQNAFRIPSLEDWIVIWIASIAFSAIAYGIGSRSSFLQWNPWQVSRSQKVLIALKLFFYPALLEEVIFRVLLVPEPGKATATELSWWVFALISLALFVVAHPINAKFFFKEAKPTFSSPTFLILAALLGLTCTIVYFMTRSLWGITLIHWAAVVIWLFLFGGMQRLTPNAAIDRNLELSK